MSYDVEIVADSVGPNGARLTTFALRYPRMIHAELMTHRMFSRNASSTRAIPTAKMIEWIEKDPAIPVYWGKNQKGMQATDELSPAARYVAEKYWLGAMHQAVDHAKRLMDLGVHKQIASRILEPWAHINVVVSATSFDNFFSLRCHKAAMPEIQKLAVMMARAYRDSVPTPVAAGDWHLPFATAEELAGLDGSTIRRDEILPACTARCARVSYKTFEGKAPDMAEDIALHDKLRAAGHWSPFEHCAFAHGGDSLGTSGNFRGWNQYRKFFGNEERRSFDFATLDQFTNDFIV